MPGTPESLRKAREALVRRRAERAAGLRPPGPDGALTFSQAFDTVFANWFAGPTWRPWRTVGKAIFAEPMTDAELAEFQEFTGRTVAPTMPAREVWLAIGRRAGKDWFCAAVIVFLACFRTHTLKVGDLGRVMLLAVDQDQASESYRYISELIDSIAETKAMVKSRSTKHGLLRLDLHNRIQILVKSADHRHVRGRTILAIVASEVAYWWDSDTNANPAAEVFRALRPSMLGVPGALLLAVSSTYARRGTLYEDVQGHWGQDGDRILVWRASTMAMRPDESPEFLDFLEQEERLDPVSFDAEYRANWRKDVEDFVSLEQVQAVIVAGRAELRYATGLRFFAFLDAAGGGGKDSAALALAVLLPNGKAAVCRVAEWKPPFSSTAIAQEIVALVKEYHVTTLVGDNFAGATWADILLKAGVGRYVVEPKSKSDLYRDLIPALNGGLVELLDPATGPTQQRVVGQLLALERRASRQGRDVIEHPRNAQDDCVNAVTGALLLALRGARSFDPFLIGAWTKNYTRPHGDGRVVAPDGTRHVHGDTFRAPSGETFIDPRGL